MINLAVQYGAQLALGTSLLLLLGLAWAQAYRSPARRHSWAECLLWSLPICMTLLVVPMHRPLGPGFLEALAVAPEASAPAELRPRGHGASTPVTVSATETSTPDAPLLAVAFLVGAALMLVYLSCGVLCLARLLRDARELPAVSGADLGRVVVAGRARRPFCVGTRARGFVVLPPSLVQPGREDQLDAVLAHERAHLRDGHGRARLVAAALSPLLYWNPLFWLLVARMRADAELCADDAAASLVGKRRYVRALINLVEIGPRHPHPALPLLGALAPTRPFLERMESLMLRSQPLDRSNSSARRAMSMALALTAVALVNVACGTTSPSAGPAPVERIAVPFEALSLDNTDLGKALGAFSKTEAPFPELVEALDGKPITIEGYIIPLRWEDDQVSEFMLLRDNLQCCMGGTPTWGHWLHAQPDGSTTGVFKPGRRVQVEGSFTLVHPRNWEPSEYTHVYQLRDWGVTPIE